MKKKKKETGGYDAIIVSWHKFNITPKMRFRLIKDLKRASIKNKHN